MAHDCHDFLNVAWQTVDVRKVCKMVMNTKNSMTMDNAIVNLNFLTNVISYIIFAFLHLLSHLSIFLNGSVGMHFF